MKAFPSVAFAVVSTALNFGAHRIVAAWAERSFPAVVAKRRLIVFACAVIAVIPNLCRFVVMRTHARVAEAAFGLSLFEFMIVLASAVPLLLLMAFSGGRKDPSEVSAVSSEGTPAPSEPAAEVTRRNAIETIGGATVLGASSLAFGWGMTIGRHDYEVSEIPVRIPGLPKELDGYVIAQISDVHAGLFVGERELREGADLLRKVRPDLIVATGDLVDIDPGQTPRLARALTDVAPRDGVFAILGNHDYYAGHVAVSEAIRAAGITLLVNDARVIRGGFGLVGVDDAWSESYGGAGPRLDVAVASLPKDAPRILLAHQPKGFFTDNAGNVALQLSGHTHGGQIFPARYLLPRLYTGRYEERGSTLYVNRGFGVAGPPARIGVPPEITKIILVAA